jgi:hypothetical protein
LSSFLHSSHWLLNSLKSSFLISKKLESLVIIS